MRLAGLDLFWREAVWAEGVWLLQELLMTIETRDRDIVLIQAGCSRNEPQDMGHADGGFRQLLRGVQ